jgi:hypothetical protein
MVVESEDEAENNADPGRGSIGAEEPRIVVENVVASSDDDETRAEVEKQLNTNGTRVKSRVNGRTQVQQATKPPLSTQQRRQKRATKTAMEVQGSEDEENNMEEELIHAEVPASRPRRAGEGTAFVEREKATGGRGRGQVKSRKHESVMDVDDVLEGQDGIKTLIDKIGRTNTVAGKASTNGDSSVKDAELAKLKEKIGQVSARVSRCSSRPKVN